MIVSEARTDLLFWIICTRAKKCGVSDNAVHLMQQQTNLNQLQACKYDYVCLIAANESNRDV